MTPRLAVIAVTLAVMSYPFAASPADQGLITKRSKYSVQETIERFENAIKTKGFMVFTEVDHAAAATKYGLELRPRTVIIFGNPKLGTGPMQKFPTLAIDVPPKALVWQDDQGSVWLTYLPCHPRPDSAGSASSRVSGGGGRLEDGGWSQDVDRPSKRRVRA